MANAPKPPAASMGDSKCSKCDRDMDDDDDLYCAACMGSTDASAMCALLGVTDSKAAIGAIVALKEKAQSADSLKAEIAALKQASEKQSIAAMIDAAVRDGRVKPAKKESMQQLAEKHGIGALSACLENLTPASAPVIPASDEAARKAAERVQAPSGEVNTFGLSAAEQKIAKATGLSFEKFAQGKKEYRAIVQPVDEENN